PPRLGAGEPGRGPGGQPDHGRPADGRVGQGRAGADARHRVRVTGYRRGVSPTEPAGYFSTRFAPDTRRDAVWRHVARHLAAHWQPGASILDVGAGYCSFINAVEGA